VVLTGANRHDVTQVENVMDGIVVTRLESTPENLQHLCADKAYDRSKARSAMEERGFVPHVRSRGEEKLEKMTDGRKARRWVVEVFLSWLNRFRKLLCWCVTRRPMKAILRWSVSHAQSLSGER
jgi:putative transposase